MTIVPQRGDIIAGLSLAGLLLPHRLPAFRRSMRYSQGLLGSFATPFSAEAALRLSRQPPRRQRLLPPRQRQPPRLFHRMSSNLPSLPLFS